MAKKRPRRPAKPQSGDSLFPGCAYGDAELEFLRAVDAYKKTRRLKFLSYTEVLGVAISLGYRKVA